MSALGVLRNPRSWLIPGVVLTSAIFAITLVFAGSVANPSADLHEAPIGLVNLDTGPDGLGAAVSIGIEQQPQQPADSVRWHRYDNLDAVRADLADNKLFAAVVLPPDYSAGLESLPTSSPHRPRITVLTNPGTGTMAAELGARIAESAARAGSVAAAAHTAPRASAAIPAANAELLADPVTVTEEAAVPLGARTGNGMTAFFYALLLMMVGFLGANVINGMIDAELGFAATEFGPLRKFSAPRLIDRSQTFAAKAAVMVVVACTGSTAILGASAAVLHLDLPHAGTLWLFGVLAISAVGIGTLAAVTLLGPLGIVLGMIFFIGWSIPVSGGAIPLQAMPPFWRWLGGFEPMRAIADGTRAITYFDAHAAAGLSRALVTLAVGLAIGLLVGVAGNIGYDRSGMHRINPHAIPHIHDLMQRMTPHRHRGERTRSVSPADLR